MRAISLQLKVRKYNEKYFKIWTHLGHVFVTCFVLGHVLDMCPSVSVSDTWDTDMGLHLDVFCFLGA